MMTDYPYELINNFEILEEIELGAYGLINKVIKRSNAYLGDHKLYIMKVVDTYKKPAEIMKYMRSEIEVLSWVCPYKIHLDCCFEDENNIYMIIDYCENGDLLKEIEKKSKSHKHFNEDEIWKYFIQICFGIEFLSVRRFNHQYLHPKNIFLDENKNIKLGDFGISQYLDNTNEKVNTVYTPSSWKKIFENTEGDIWAAGCVLYYLLTLENPLKGNSKTGHNIKSIKGKYSDEIKSFADWCLRENRNERPKINQILTHEFIVDKTMSFGIIIPQNSVIRIIYNPIEEIKEIVYPQIEIPLLKSINKTSAKAQNGENNILTLQEIEEKTAEILNRPIDFEIEQDFRRICLIYEKDNSIYDQPLIQAYQNYIKIYHQCASVYNVGCKSNKSHLITYNTETETKEIKVLKIREELDKYTSIVKLPGGKLFCFSNYDFSGITLIIEENGRVKTLPSGSGYYLPALIYFNSSVYRFGGQAGNLNTAQSARFDLVKNQWFKLPSMPTADWFLSGIVFNKNLLLPGYIGKNILIYSNDIESYSVISYDFAAYKGKLLINAEKRLYLVEGQDRLIYESEAEDEYSWKRIAKITYDLYPYQSYWLYNKGAIYIGIATLELRVFYYKFSLNEKYWTDF